MPELGPAQRAGKQPDWFMLCLEALAEVIKAYRIATKSPIQEVSYSRLPPVMFAITVPMLEGGVEGASDAAYYTLNSWGGQWIEAQSDDLDTESLLEYTTRLAQRLSVSDPLLTYTDRMWRARRALEVEGEFDSAVLHAAIAVEAYLVALWLHLQWEKGEKADVALSRVGQLGGKKPTRTILSWLGQDLGGVWRSESNARVAAWVDGLMPLRNRVAHGGVRVSHQEAEISIAAAEAIERFAANRLEERWATYPRTSVLAIGHDRLRKRWGDRSVDKFFEQTKDEPFYAIAFASWVSGDSQGPQAI